VRRAANGGGFSSDFVVGQLDPQCTLTYWQFANEGANVTCVSAMPNRMPEGLSAVCESSPNRGRPIHAKTIAVVGSCMFVAVAHCVSISRVSCVMCFRSVSVESVWSKNGRKDRTDSDVKLGFP
jgi:hypothetical protein